MGGQWMKGGRRCCDVAVLDFFKPFKTYILSK